MTEKNELSELIIFFCMKKFIAYDDISFLILTHLNFLVYKIHDLGGHGCFLLAQGLHILNNK